MYPNHLREDIYNLIDPKNTENSPVIDIDSDCIDAEKVPHHFCIRHFESAYNEYKEKIKWTSARADFLQEEDLIKKQDMYRDLSEEFYKNVWPDARTGLSKKWLEQGEVAGRFWQSFYNKNPELFPDMIAVSPYLRTRLTAYHSLRDVGLDMDLEFLKNPSPVGVWSGMYVWSFHGKDVVLRLSEVVRERDHGKIGAPRVLERVMNDFKRRHNLPQTMQEYIGTLLSRDEYDEEHYYKTLFGGESQTQVNARASQYLQHLKNSDHMMTMTFSHHLFKLWLILKTMWGSYPNFKNFDNHYKPKNWSLSIITKVPETQSGQKNKMRFSLYNAEIKETLE